MSFSRVLYRAINEDFSGSGTIFLIQGAPGAGKTALLHKFSDVARAGGKKWKTLGIDESALYDPAALMRQAGKTYKSEETTEWTGRAKQGFRRVSNLRASARPLINTPTLV